MLGLLLASLTALLAAAPVFFEPLWPLAWVAFIPFFAALRRASPRWAFVLGWWAETLMYWVGFYWLVGTMVWFGFISVPLSLFFFAVIGIGNGLRLGFFAWWLRRLEAGAHPWWVRLLLPACLYVTLDFLVPRVFPWYLGFLQFPALPFIQIADLTGIHGVTFLLIMCSTVGTLFVPGASQDGRSMRRRMSLVVALLLLGQVSYGFWRIRHVSNAMQQAPSLRVALIQPNIGMYEKDSGSKRSQLDLQMALSQQTLAQHPDIIIWPESMYPFAVPRQATSLPVPAAGDGETYWLLGALTYSGQGVARQVFNSALLVASDGRILGRYDKQQLLAFGEYIPLQRYLPFLRHISPTIGNLTPGQGSLVTLPHGISMGPLICYEDILPALSRQAVREGAQLLVNLTNDVWFGPTRAPYQHRTLAAFRAVENRVPLIRVTNTGLTSVIDALGREQATLSIYQPMTLVHDVQPLQLATVYTRFGDWFAYLCGLVAVGISLWQWWGRHAMKG